MEEKCTYLTPSDRIAVDNAIGLLEECVENGRRGHREIGAWFDGEADNIGNTLAQLKEM